MEKEEKSTVKSEVYGVADYFKSPNFMATSKHRSTLLEYKLFIHSLADISLHRNIEIDEKTGILYNQIKMSDFKKVVNCNNGSFYQQLSNAAKNLTGRVLGVTNPENQTFEFVSIIAKTTYEDGVLTVGYNPLVRDWLLKVDNNFTIQSRALLTSFNSVFTCRLYEVLKKDAFCPKWKKAVSPNSPNNIFEIPYSLAELRFMLGAADINDPAVRDILDNEQRPNYDKALEVCKSQRYKSWFEFKRSVLEVAVNEINTSPLSDMNVTYELFAGGRGGKIKNVAFTVTLVRPGSNCFDAQNENMDEENLVETDSVYGGGSSEIDYDDILDQISDIIKEPLKIKDIRSIAEAAKYDVEKVKNAYNVLQSYAKNKTINNVPGFMIDAIRKGSETVEKKKVVEPAEKRASGNAKTGKKNKFNDFMQNEYDFEQLEAELLSN